MSLNQSRLEKNESLLRKPGGGRSGSSSGGQRRTFSGGRGRGGGGVPGPTTIAPTNRSYKKTDNAQGGNSRGALSPVNTSDSDNAAGARSVENGGHVQSTLHGVSKAPAPAPAHIIKTADTAQKSSRPLPRAPSSQSSSMTSDSTLPTTPAKGDGGKGFSLQFGSISPGFMNGMQVPARTSSAPPNLDEQKRDQARRDASRAVAPAPLPSAPKQEVPKKDAAPSQQKIVTQEIHAESKTKRDVLVASVSPPTQPQKPSALPIAGVSMPLPFHQPTVSMQFGGPNPQIQPQGMATSSLQMPIQVPIQMGNPSQVPQQVFVPGLQHHLMQNQGIMHQGQNLGFNRQMGNQLPHQLGNLGMNMPTQFNQQQPAKFGSTRKTVKITHPDTHEELRLDNRDGGSSGSRTHHSGPPQSQSLPTYTPSHPIGYYSNSYTAGPPFFPTQSSLPLTSAQLTAGSQVPRYNYPVSQAPPTMPFMNQSASNTVPVSTSGASMHVNPGSSNLDYGHDVQNIVPSAQPTSTPVNIKVAGGAKVIDSDDIAIAEPHKLLNQTVEPGVRKDLKLKGDSSSLQSSVLAYAETSSLGTESAALTGSAREPASVMTHADAIKRENVTKSTSVEDIKKQLGKKGHPGSSHQVSGQADLTFQASGDSSKGVASESAEAKLGLTSSGLRDGASEAIQASPVITDTAPSDICGIDLGTKSFSHSSDTLQEKITRESAVTKEREEEPVSELHSDNSLKAEGVLKMAVQDGKLKRDGNVMAVTEASQRESKTGTSGINGEKLAAQASSFEYGSSNISNCGSMSDSTSSLGMKDNEASKSTTSGNEGTSVSANLSNANLEHERDDMGDTKPNSSSEGSSKTSVEANKMKNNRGKKKWKEMLQKADALGTTSDLYMAYKGPEEKKEIVVATEVICEGNSMEVSADAKLESNNEDEPSKHEPDDWEDAADVSTPKLQSAGGDEEGVTAKKYSRDFLLTFAEHCVYLPEDLEIASDIDVLLRVNVNASRGEHEHHPSPARIVDRPAGAVRLDRRGNGTMEADRWGKLLGPCPSGRDPGLDLAYNSNVMGFRAGPGPNYGVLRNPRQQGTVQPAGGILSGPMHSLGFQRNNSDADRWQRATNFNKGLMPPPQTPSQVMHRAENKYEVGKITDEEQAKQRKLKGILNKLTPQNFERLFEQVKEVNIDNVVTLTGVISQIFDKALTEPTFCEMYANFCYHLASELPDLSVDDEKITFRRLLLNKCQEEFERGEREEQEANEVADGEGEIKQSEGEREEKRLKARRRMLGNIRLIGELYKKRMLTERIMHECIKKLLGQYENPDEENIEALCKLMSTIGEMIDHPRAKEHMDAYFEIMGQLSNNMKLSSRVRFMLRDSIDLRKNKWQQRRKVEGPKKIEEVHRDAAQERQGQAQAARLSRGPSMNSAMRRGQPLEFGPRSSVLSSPVGQGGGFRGMPSQVRGYAVQDVRINQRNVFDHTPSVPLPQRSTSDEPITLGPQGGLARGMVSRGQPSLTSSPLLDSSPSFGDPRRMGGGLNGYNTASREEHFTRRTSERFNVHDQSSNQELNASHTNRDSRYADRNMDRSRPMTPPVARVGGSPTQSVSSVKVLPEERLRDMSIAAIREYYSAKDEKEITLCIKDLNAPGFYPNVVSIWVTDSFERKDMERDMLANLLINLAKQQQAMFSPAQLIEGFESVLTNLEDTVNDAPKAPEYLGRIFGKVVLENVLPLKEVGRLIHEGGEERGSLLEAGLAGDVLGSILEMIKLEKGETVLNEIRAASNLRLEDFRPPDPIKSRKLEMFM